MTAVDEAVDEILDAVVQAAPEVRAGLWERRGSELDIDHPTGDAVIGADVFADEVFYDHLTDLAVVGEYASEDREESIDVGDGLAVTVDPLDGSSNVASNNLVGSIVGIYDDDLPAGGDGIVASAYVVYGPITTMVVAVGYTVTELAITEDGARRLRRDVTLPDDPVVYGFGGRVPQWPDDFAAFVDEIESELKLRYGGAMIGDVNQVLSYGGIFAYPALRDTPEGKLRLQFEAIPMGHVIETAGGGSSDGARSLLEIEPDGLHDRIPVHLGNETLIDRLEAALE